MNPRSTAAIGHLCPDASFDVVAIAASTGGIQALRTLLAALPAAFPAAMLVQIHLNPSSPSVLTEILQPHANVPVVWAVDGAVLRQSTVIVAPPGQHVQLTATGRLALTSWEERGYTKPRADGLFESVAARFQTRALGVVLTGYLDDGARGARAIRRHGGRVLVQSPVTAEAPAMPIATLRTGCADFVLPLPGLAAALTALVTVRGLAQFLAVPDTPHSQPYREALRTWGA